VPGRGIFLSYRREETSHIAGRLADRLSERFGRSRVFIDVDSIDPGLDFVQAIDKAIENCDVLLALIGPKWAVESEDGTRRIDNAEDYVRLELRAALARGIRVIPVLVDGARMPTSSDLPVELQPLVHRNAVRLDHETFRSDADSLIYRMRPRKSLYIERRSFIKWALGGTVLGAAGALWALTRPHDGGTVIEPTWVGITGDEIYSSPTVSNGMVYVGSVDSHLYAFDAANGKLRWRYRTEGAVTSSPAIGDGIVFVGSNDSRVHAVDAMTGQARWTFAAGAALHSSPAVDGGTLFIGCRDHYLYALDTLTGNERWKFQGGGWFNSSPTVTGGSVYIGCRDQQVYSVDAKSGVKRWSYRTESTVDSSAAVSGHAVYIGGDDHYVYALDASTGTWIWSYSLGGGVVSTPYIVGRVVYVGSDDGNLYALDADTGRERWRFHTENSIRSTPTESNGWIYVGSRDFYLYAVNATTGVLGWRFATGAPIDDSSPTVAMNTVFIGSLDRRLYAIPIPQVSGAPLGGLRNHGESGFAMKEKAPHATENSGNLPQRENRHEEYEA
jgi:outer membrane protein assembly factor BamB